MNVLEMLVPRVFEIAALVTDVPDVFVSGVNFLDSLMDRNVENIRFGRACLVRLFFNFFEIFFLPGVAAEDPISLPRKLSAGRIELRDEAQMIKKTVDGSRNFPPDIGCVCMVESLAKEIFKHDTEMSARWT